VKHQHKSTRNISLPIGHANANAQHSKGHLKSKIYLPRQQRPPLEGERDSVATNGYTHSSSGQSTPQKLAHSQNESHTLVTISIESENLQRGEIPRVRLASVRWHTDDVNCPARSRAAASNGLANSSHGQTDGSRGCTDALNVSNNAETARLGFGDGAETYLGARDTKRDVDETDGLGGHADASNGQTDAPSVQTDALMPANAPEIVSTNPTELQPPDPLTRGENCRTNNSQGLGNPADTLNMRTHAYSVVNDARTPINAIKIVSTRPNDPKWPNSPVGDTKHGVDLADGLTSHTDTSTGHEGAHSVKTDALKPANATQIVRTRQIHPKPPDSPNEATWQRSDEPNASRHHSDALSGHMDAPSIRTDAITLTTAPGTVSTHPIELKPTDSPVGDAKRGVDVADGFWSHTDRSSAHTDVQSIGNDAKMATNETENVRTRQHSSKTRNSLHTTEIATPKYTREVPTASAQTLLDTCGHVEYYTCPMIGRVLVYYKIHSKNNLSKVVKWGGGPSSTCGGGVVIGSGEGSAGVVSQAVVDKRW